MRSFSFLYNKKKKKILSAEHVCAIVNLMQFRYSNKLDRNPTLHHQSQLPTFFNCNYNGARRGEARLPPILDQSSLPV